MNKELRKNTSFLYLRRLMASTLCDMALREFARSKGLIRWASSNSLHTKSYNKKSRIRESIVPVNMKAWQLADFQGVENIKMGDMRVPALNSPTDVLIKVDAASLNPLDVMMSNGYGKELLGKAKQLLDTRESSDHFPLILGRDFSGEIVDVGMDVSDYDVGDEVFGALFPSSQGSLANFVLASKYSIYHKPKSLSHHQAASLPYAGLTAWSALSLTAQLSLSDSQKPKNVLVIGASGGVGTIAVQLLKIWNCKVIATCQDDAFEMVNGLGADVVLDYKSPEFLSQLQQLQGKIDVVFDCAGSSDKGYQDVLKRWKNSIFVSLSSPLLSSTDTNGIVCGLLGTAKTLFEENLTAFTSQGSTKRWGYYMTNPTALKQIAQYAEAGQIKPVIQDQFKMEKVPEAFEKLQNRGSRGKIVIDMK